MKTLYHLLLTVFFSLIIFPASNFAQENEFVPKESIVKKAYEICPSSLNSNIQGIVESSIYNVILLKKYYSAADYSWIIDKLNEIAEKNMDPAIRFKAHLASLYLSFSDIINVNPETNVFDHEYIYKQISNQLENQIVLN